MLIVLDELTSVLVSERTLATGETLEEHDWTRDVDVVSVKIVVVDVVVVNCAMPGKGVSNMVDVYTVSVVVDEGMALGMKFEVAIDEGSMIVVILVGTVTESVTVDCWVC